jgi:hypothetical protein
VKIREILVQTKRSQKNAFGAALHTTPFYRMNGNIKAGGDQLFCNECTSTCESAIYHPPHNALARNAFGAARHTMPFDRVNGDI